MEFEFGGVAEGVEDAEEAKLETRNQKLESGREKGKLETRKQKLESGKQDAGLKPRRYADHGGG